MLINYGLWFNLQRSYDKERNCFIVGLYVLKHTKKPNHGAHRQCLLEFQLLYLINYMLKRYFFFFFVISFTHPRVQHMGSWCKSLSSQALKLIDLLLTVQRYLMFLFSPYLANHPCPCLTEERQEHRNPRFAYSTGTQLFHRHVVADAARTASCGQSQMGERVTGLARYLCISSPSSKRETPSCPTSNKRQLTFCMFL